jgi:hypothetical protein
MRMSLGGNEDTGKMSESRCLLVVGLLVLAPAAAVRSQEASARTAAIEGTVRDWASGRPILRARVCAFWGGLPAHAIQCAVADTAGEYFIGQLYSGVQLLQFECETGRMTFDVRQLDTVRVTVAAHDTLAFEARVPMSGCDQRPYEIVAGDFRGHWAFGFELDDFVPCNDTTKHAWVERQGLRSGELWHLPEAELYEGGNRWFVRWRGVWIGPRSLLPSYHMVVDSVLDMGVPQSDDCAG